MRLIPLFFLLPMAAMAERNALDYLYSPQLPVAQQPLAGRINTHLRNAELGPAMAMSQELVEEVEPLKKSTTTYGQVLINHGIIQSAAEDYDASLAMIEQGLQVMEMKTNRFSQMLINGIMAKGVTEMAMGRPEQAEDTFRRAQHITHRQGGVHTKEQLPIVHYLTSAHLWQGQRQDADREQFFSLRIAERSHGSGSLELLPTLNRLGIYFASRGGTLPISVDPDTRNRMFRTSLHMHKRAFNIIERNFGGRDVRLVQPLRGMARARMLQMTNMEHAEIALERSLAIIRAHPGSDLSDRARALVDLGDIYVITADDRASATYLEAWHLLQETPETQRVANNFFDEPVRIYPPRRLHYLKRFPRAVEAGEPLFVDLAYSVTTKGRVQNVKVLKKNVPNAQARQLRQRMKNTRFRPRIQDANMARTEGLVIRQTFKVINADRNTAESTLADDEIL